MGQLTRDDLLKKEELAVEKVDLGEDDFTFVREMYGSEREQFELSISEKIEDKKTGKIRFEQRLDNYRAKLAVCTVCDEEGNLLFEPGDYLTLSKSMKARKLATIADAAQKLNKMTEEEKEGLVKNSDAGETGDSGSDYVEISE